VTDLIGLFAGATCVWPFAACAQQLDRVRRLAVLNIKTANALGLVVPRIVLARADEIID
jgi:hypothetical protein